MVQQELFSEILLNLRDKFNNDVYDGYLPDEGAKYPFIYVGDNNQMDLFTKDEGYGTVRQTLHVWHNNPQQRGTVSKIVQEIKRACYLIKRTAHYSFFVTNISCRILEDNSASASFNSLRSPLVHAVIDVNFSYS